jgi:hypothetical protein
MDITEASSSRSLQESIMNCSSELAARHSTLQGIMKKDLGLKPFKPEKINELYGMDTCEATCKDSHTVLFLHSFKLEHLFLR